MTRHSDSPHHRVVIVGGGFSGLGMAIELISRKIRDFVVLEKGTQLGGTWRDNTYPGCACDVPSHLYSLSYAPKSDWSRVFAPGHEIQRYLLAVAERFGVQPHVRRGTEALAIRWHEDAQHWVIDTNRGRFTANVVVTGAGPLHEPRVPELAGIERFGGESFHSSRWRHDVDLTDLRVAVVGTGSSAIQFLPEIQPRLKKLVLFQRTAPWVLPKPDHAYPKIQQRAFDVVPGFRRAYRAAIFGALELLGAAERSARTMQRVQGLALRHLRRQVTDVELQRTLTPTFTLGCKRLLLSNTYYPALQQRNVTVVDGGLRQITERGVVGPDGVQHEVDAIIWGTGFRVTDPPIAERITGKDGRTLASHWNGSPRAYLGTAVTGFPNLFFMIGPNLGNGHSSAFTLIEAQARYIGEAVSLLQERALSSVEVRAGVQARYNDRVQAALVPTVWNAGGCASYYLDRNGTNSSIYPWSTLHLRRRLRRFDAEYYALRAAPAVAVTHPRPTARIALTGAVVAITGGARGIGLACAEQFVAQGAIVCIGDVDADQAQLVAARLGAHALPLDVARRESYAAFVETIERTVGPIDVLVNNAGVMPTGAFVEEPDSVDAATMSINYLGTSLGMKLVLPAMIGRGRGHVVNVASMAGRVHVPGLATYVASKHATVGLSRAVREELQGTGVTITTILPGAVRTRLSAGIDLRGVPAVESAAVARAVVGSVRDRAPEVAVPRLLAVAPLALSLLPPRLMRILRRGLRANRLLTRRDTSERAAYEAAIQAQGDAIVGSANPAPRACEDGSRA